MRSEKFRRQLLHEIKIWLDEGIIDESIYQQLHQRYQLGSIDKSARDRFILILLIFGSILIGLGVITFVASNWQVLNKWQKITLLQGLFIVVNVGGFYTWRSATPSLQRLGNGLLVLGALILGANMGLMSQIFHISGEFFQLMLAWAIGILCMSFSLRLTSLGVLSIILLNIGYISFLTTDINTIQGLESSWLFTLIGEHYSLMMGLFLIPLAYWCGSRIIFFLASASLFLGLVVNLIMAINTDGIPLALIIPCLLLWAYDDSSWVYGNSDWVRTQISYAPIARNIVLVYLSILLYLSSFHWFWLNLGYGSSNGKLSPHLLIDPVIFMGLAIWEWMRLLTKRGQVPQEILTNIMVGILLLVMYILMVLAVKDSNQISWLATYIGNILLFLLALGLVREGIGKGERWSFWGGIILIGFKVLAWTFFSVNDLIWKALMFVVCGIGAIALGLWYEKYIRTLNQKP